MIFATEPGEVIPEAKMDGEFIRLLSSLATGSIGGGLLVYFLNRARPRADITDVALFAPFSNVSDETLFQDRIRGTTETKTTIFVTPKAVQDATIKNKYIERQEVAYNHPQPYINYIYRALQINEFWREQYKVMPDVINTIMLNLNSSLRESLHTFVRYYQPIWNELIASFVEKKVDLPDSAGSSESGKQFYRIYLVNTTQLIGWGVAIEENLVNFTLLREFSGPTEETLAFANKLVKVLAFHDVESLKYLLGFLQDADWHSSTFDETEEALRDQVEKHFSRIIVRGLLINKGKTSYAVSGDPKMRLHMKGLSYESRETGRHESLHMDIELRMRCVEDDYLKHVPTITVNPGTAEPFLAVSEDYLRDMADCEAIEAAFASERRCQVEFELTERPKRIRSRESPVRTVRIGSGENQVLPRTPSMLTQLLQPLKRA